MSTQVLKTLRYIFPMLTQWKNTPSRRSSNEAFQKQLRTMAGCAGRKSHSSRAVRRSLVRSCDTSTLKGVDGSDFCVSKNCNERFDIHLVAFITLALFFTITAHKLDHCHIKITQEMARTIGQKIWYNESRNSIEKLTWWKKGESWASLGIGHFIWYPINYTDRYAQSFPDLLNFLQKQGISLPAWLAKAQGCPWSTEKQFFTAFDSSQMKELRALLKSTIELQTMFIIEQFEQRFSSMIDTMPPAARDHVKTQFHRVAKSSAGIYALVDYHNFKGAGVDTKERYNNQGWGLLQIFERMNGTRADQALAEFSTQAKELLTLRVKNAPPDRHEEQWLKGWHNRINTYLAP